MQQHARVRVNSESSGALLNVYSHQAMHVLTSADGSIELSLSIHCSYASRAKGTLGPDFGCVFFICNL